MWPQCGIMVSIWYLISTKYQKPQSFAASFMTGAEPSNTRGQQ